MIQLSLFGPPRILGHQKTSLSYAEAKAQMQEPTGQWPHNLILLDPPEHGWRMGQPPDAA